ncbi:hypothetical protein ABZ383_12810 [Streptomyces sp. NPDC005900]|uniref:restriction endonuclease subunit S n=1 Tax=unclassified Streptomyces TaxID=2593676 RepID=UPI0033E08175
MTACPQWMALDDLPGVEVVGYGVNRPGPVDAEGVPMLRAGDIVDGRVQASEAVRVGHAVADAHPRTRLRTGDLLVVLVGRIGEAAITGPAQEGWQVARSVALVRCDDLDLARWLRAWLAVPAARAWCEARAAGSVQRTLGLKWLRQLPVALPSVAERDRALRVITAVESRIDVNDRIARTSVELADAHFDVLTRDRSSWPVRTFGDIVRKSWTSTAARSPVPREEETWVAAADVLHNSLPHVCLDAEEQSCEAAGSVLLVPKDGQVHAAVGPGSVAVSRGVLVLQPEQAADTWWLLHEIRSRSSELARLAQGTAGRELSVRAIGNTEVAKPPQEELAHFVERASTLHARALTATRESHTLRALLTGFLRTLEPADSSALG